MAANNQELALRLQQQGARMTPMAFDQGMADLYLANKKKLIEFAGDEKTARKYMSALVYTASRNTSLLECDKKSLFDCCVQAAQLGLWPGPLQQCAFVPFKGKAQFMPMVQGLQELAYRSGKVKSIQARVVYEADEFDYCLGADEYLKHKPFLGPEKERGEAICVYAVIQTSTDRIIEVRSIDWVEGIRSRSAAVRSGRSTPWDTDWEEMAVKSVIKNALKKAPKSAELAQAIEADNAVERPDLVKAKVIDISDPFEEDSGASTQDIPLGEGKNDNEASLSESKGL